MAGPPGAGTRSALGWTGTPGCGRGGWRDNRSVRRRHNRDRLSVCDTSVVWSAWWKWAPLESATSISTWRCGTDTRSAFVTTLVGVDFCVGHVECFLQGRFVAPSFRGYPARVFAPTEPSAEQQRCSDRQGGGADVRDEDDDATVVEMADAVLRVSSAQPSQTCRRISSHRLRLRERRLFRRAHVGDHC